MNGSMLRDDQPWHAKTLTSTSQTLSATSERELDIPVLRTELKTNKQLDFFFIFANNLYSHKIISRQREQPAMLRPLRSALPRASSLSAPPTSLIHHCRLRRYNHTNSQPPSPTVRKKSPSPRPIPTYLHTHIHPNKKKTMYFHTNHNKPSPLSLLPAPTGRLLQDLHAARGQVRAHRGAGVPGRVLWMDEAGARGDQGRAAG